jgi:ankyrin repeat protein
MPNSHDKVLQCMKQLGYTINEEGMCYGSAFACMSAVLLNDIATFDKRLDIIEDIVYKQKNLAVEINVVRKKAREKKLLNTEEEIILGMPAFFDTIVLFQHGHLYPYLFEKNKRPIAQNAELVFIHALPNDLAQNIEKVDTFCGVYNVAELEDYFSSLHRSILEEQSTASVCFLLGSFDHIFLITYNFKKNSWVLVNTDHSQEISEDKHIAEKVLRAFSKNDIAVFETAIYTKKTDYVQIRRLINTWKDKKTWGNLHKISRVKTKLKDSAGASWLIIASQIGQTEYVKLLLQSGADPNHACDDKLTALYAACANGNFAVVELLLKNKANPNKVSLKNLSPLCLVCQLGYVDIAKLLLQNKADPMQKLVNGSTPIHVACENGHYDIVNLLLQHQPDSTIKKEYDIEVLLNHARDNNFFHSFKKLLIRNEVSLSPNSKINLSPLDIAIFLGFSDIVQLLLSYNIAQIKIHNWDRVDLAVAVNRINIVYIMADLLNRYLQLNKDEFTQKRFVKIILSINNKINQYRLEKLEAIFNDEFKRLPKPMIGHLFKQDNIPIEVVLGGLIVEKEKLLQRPSRLFVPANLKKQKLDSIIDHFREYLMEEKKLTEKEAELFFNNDQSLKESYKRYITVQPLRLGKRV